MKHHKLLGIMFIFAIAALITGCGSVSSIEKANNAYDLYQFNTAVEMYKKILTKEKDKKVKAEVTLKVANCYRFMNEYSKAENYYRKVVKMPNSDPIAYYYLGEMLKRQEKYEDAIIAFKDYIREVPGDPVGETALKSAEDAIQWKKEKTRYVVEPFKIVNSKANDFALMYYRKGAFVFTSDREESTGGNLFDWTMQKHTDIYFIEPEGKSTTKYKKPALIDEDQIVNTKFNEGVVTFDSRFNTMYYTQCNDASGKGHNCRIFVIRKKGKVWGEPEVLGFCTDSFTMYGHPSLSPDGKKLYFVSDMEGGYGGLDIWMATYVKRGKTWGDPVNLGPVINTTGDEMFPFAYTNDRLYFSSNGHPGMGGLDIFYSDKVDDVWTKPVNMKSPVNSGGDDFAVIVEKGGTIAKGYRGYFSSNRPGSKGDDIYQFYMTPLEYTLSGTVFNLKTKEVIPDATVTLTINDTFRVAVKTDASGGYKFQLAPENEYSVDAFKKFFFDSEIKYVSTVGLEFSEDFVRDLYLDPFLPVDVELQGIYYDLDKYTLRPESMVVLDSLYNIMMKHPYIVIEIGSHTDCRASVEYNQKLSENRAKAVTDYLEYRGIPPDRMQAIGYGESQIANGCTCEGNEGPGLECTEEQHQQNRRTTFRIIRTDYVYPDEYKDRLDQYQREHQLGDYAPAKTMPKEQRKRYEEQENQQEQEPEDE